MTIVYIHGFGSTAATSSTCQSLQDWFPGDEVVCLDYDYMNPHQSAEDLLEEIEDIGHENIDLVVGSSLGGFWARYVANEYNIPLMMINPSLDPARNLRKRGLYTEAALQNFEDYYIENDAYGLPITIVLGMSDTVCNPNITFDKYKDRAKIFTLVNEGHQIRSNTLKDFVSYAANSVCIS